MSKDLDYRPTHTYLFYQIQPQLDTNLTLFRLKNNTQVSMELAKNVSINEIKKTMRVELKKSCGWSDGTRIDAHHLLKGIHLYFEKTEHPSIFSNLFKNSKAVLDRKADSSTLGVRILNDFTLEFDLVSPPDLLMQALSYPVFTPAPIHLMKNDPKSWPVKSIVRISSGAYKAVSYEDYKKIEMIRNPYFCKDIPVNFDHVDFIGKYQRTTSVKDMLVKKVDAVFEIDKEQAMRQIKNNPHSSGFTLGNYIEDTTVSLFINTNNVVVRNKKVRQAISLVMNYALINRIISPDGNSSDNMGISVPYSGYKKIKLSDFSLPMDRRIIKAKQLMESLGYGPNNKIKLNFLGSKVHLFTKTQLAVASMLKQIYVDANINAYKHAQYWDNIKNGNYDLLLTGWTADFHDPSNFLEGTLDSLLIPPLLSKTLTEQLKRTYTIYNKNKRFNALAKVEHSILESFYVIPLFRIQRYYLLRPGFRLLDEPIMSARNIINENCKPSLTGNIN